MLVLGEVPERGHLITPVGHLGQQFTPPSPEDEEPVGGLAEPVGQRDLEDEPDRGPAQAGEQRAERSGRHGHPRRRSSGRTVGAPIRRRSTIRRSRSGPGQSSEHGGAHALPLLATSEPDEIATDRGPARAAARHATKPANRARLPTRTGDRNSRPASLPSSKSGSAPRSWSCMPLWYSATIG